MDSEQIFTQIGALGIVSVISIDGGVGFLPTGGVTPENLPEYRQEKAVLAVGGTWLAPREEISSHDWQQIAERCRRAVILPARTA